MPLPESAIDFLDEVVESVQYEGIIHLYSFVENEGFSPVEEKVSKVMTSEGCRFEFLKKVNCGDKSPNKDRYCVEVEVFLY